MKFLKKDKIVYIIGHRNPDTDSICSAIAYADIKNRIAKENEIYEAKRAGQLNEETEFVLNYFEMEPPALLQNVGTQVKDMEIRMTPGASRSLSVKRAWKLMQDADAVTLPITDDEGMLQGIITKGDIAESYMDAYDNTILAKAKTQYASIADTLDGTVLVGNEMDYFVKGHTWFGAIQSAMTGSYIKEHDLVVLGNRVEDQIFALEANVSCMIVCLNAKVSPLIQTLAKERDIVIISTPYDTFTVARLIQQSIPIQFFMHTDNLITFKLDDFTEDIKDVMAKVRFRAFPVTDGQGKYVGTISRRNWLDIKKKNLILVDHNDKSQAVSQIEEAEILEIVDHHRIGTLETMQPVMFRNEPVGCTATIMYKIYKENRLEIPKKIAGLLCSAILSDTLMFRSPTCTLYDKEVAEELAKIAEIDMESYASKMFKAGSNLASKSAEEIFKQDYKVFDIGNVTFGVGQISFMSDDELEGVKERLKPYIEKEIEKLGVKWVYFMLTDILHRSTQLLCFGKGAKKLVEETFEVSIEQGECYLEGVVSRKKQLIPKFMMTLQQ